MKSKKITFIYITIVTEIIAYNKHEKISQLTIGFKKPMLFEAYYLIQYTIKNPQYQPDLTSHANIYNYCDTKTVCSIYYNQHPG